MSGGRLRRNTTPYNLRSGCDGVRCHEEDHHNHGRRTRSLSVPRRSNRRGVTPRRKSESSHRAVSVGASGRRCRRSRQSCPTSSRRSSSCSSSARNTLRSLSALRVSFDESANTISYYTPSSPINRSRRRSSSLSDPISSVSLPDDRLATPKSSSKLSTSGKTAAPKSILLEKTSIVDKPAETDS